MDLYIIYTLMPSRLMDGLFSWPSLVSLFPLLPGLYSTSSLECLISNSSLTYQKWNSRCNSSTNVLFPLSFLSQLIANLSGLPCPQIYSRLWLLFIFRHQYSPCTFIPPENSVDSHLKINLEWNLFSPPPLPLPWFLSFRPPTLLTLITTVDFQLVSLLLNFSTVVWSQNISHSGLVQIDS